MKHALQVSYNSPPSTAPADRQVFFSRFSSEMPKVPSSSSRTQLPFQLREHGHHRLSQWALHHLLRQLDNLIRHCLARKELTHLIAEVIAIMREQRVRLRRIPIRDLPQVILIHIYWHLR